MLRETKSFKLMNEKEQLYMKIDLFIESVKNKNISIDEKQLIKLLNQLDDLNKSVLLITNEQNDIKQVIFDIFSNPISRLNHNQLPKNYLKRIKETLKNYRRILKLMSLIEENVNLMDTTIDNIKELVNKLPKTEYDIFKINNYNDIPNETFVGKLKNITWGRRLSNNSLIEQILAFKMLHLELGVHNLLIENYFNFTNVEYVLGYHSELDYVTKKNNGILTKIYNKKNQQQCDEALKLLLPILSLEKPINDHRITRIMAQKYYHLIKEISDIPSHLNSDKIYYK